MHRIAIIAALLMSISETGAGYIADRPLDQPSVVEESQ
ncbi:hypothetical protein LCGC14_0752690 [marine sediment metagenome]|uniref:Uncharacterized protein n=1 Tax=marine sediment metagenome TaxID=412755 RepID=A0A0F9Q7Q9_9ZZZZ